MLNNDNLRKEEGKMVIMDMIHQFFIDMTQTPESIAMLIGGAVGVIVAIILVVRKVIKSKSSKKDTDASQ